jgi:hypothetical protein
MFDFDLGENDRRYASVCSVMGGGDDSRIKATGVTLLPSEHFARVVTDLAFCQCYETRRLMLNKSKTCATSLATVK